ncbi:MAG: DUF6034 family protein [Roseburia sp.]|nr:DUF6034 family protein [Roseburia sp.]
MKNRERAAVLLAAVGIGAAALNGCGGSVQTSEEVVVTDNQGTGQMTVVSDMRANTAVGTVAEQVQAPELYRTEVSSESVRLTADAELVIPDVAGIKIKKVTGRVFTQEDYDAVNRVLLGGGKLWERDYEALADSHGFFREELDEKIAEMERRITEEGLDGNASYAGKAITLNRQIAEWKALREKAVTADEAEARGLIKELPAVVTYDAALSETGENDLDGTVTVGGQNYSVWIDNNATEETNMVCFSVEKMDGDGNYLPFSDTKPDVEHPEDIVSNVIPKPGLENMELLPEEVWAQALEAVKQMGIGEFAVQSGLYYACWSCDESVADAPNFLAGIGYGMHFARVVDGIPIRYSWENGGELTDEDIEKWALAVEQRAMGETVEEDIPVVWPFEELTLIWNNDGFRTFEWRNPYTIEDLSEEYVFLLPFSDISNIFEEMMLKKQADSFNNEGDTVDIHVEQVVLSYMRIREKESMEGTLIPVWDFLGTKTFKNAAGEVDLVREYTYESLLTVNAMDGTVLDRWSGY